MKYKVITPVDHDGERFEAGADIELDPKTADPLLAVNAIAKPDKAEPAPKAAK